MGTTQNAPKGWKVVMTLIDEDGNVKLERSISAEREVKNHPYTVGVLPTGVPKYARPNTLEWKGKELLKAVKADGTAAKIDGKDAGFEVEFKVRFSDYEVQLQAKNYKPVAKVPSAKMGIEM